MPAQPYFSGFDAFSADSQTRLMPEAIPHYLNPDSETEAIVICVHGFTGVTYEVYPAVEALAEAGLSAVAPLLPGHGYQDPADQRQQFAQITKDGLLDAARQEIARARQRYRRVGMFGFSMGGAIALTMAAEGLLDACAVAAPALRLPRKAELLIPLLSWASFTLAAPPTEPFYLPVYDFLHSWALRALWQVANHARRQLSKIQCPVLAIHSHNDLTVPPVVLGLMQRQIPIPIETAWFDHSGHCMLLDKSGPEVVFTVTKFLQRHLVS
jgi:carboxylesterase